MKKFVILVGKALFSKIPVVGDIHQIKSVITEDSKQGEYKWSEAIPRIIVTLAIAFCSIYGLYKGVIEEDTYKKIMRMIMFSDILN